MFLEFLKDSIQVRLDDISKSSKDYGKKIKDLEKEKRTNDLKIQQMEKVNIKLPHPFLSVLKRLQHSSGHQFAHIRIVTRMWVPLYRKTIILLRFAVNHYFSR